MGWGPGLTSRGFFGGARTRVGAGTLSGGEVMVLGWVGALVANPFQRRTTSRGKRVEASSTPTEHAAGFARRFPGSLDERSDVQSRRGRAGLDPPPAELH